MLIRPLLALATLACSLGAIPSDPPAPRVVTPGATPGAAPSDAIILFDGTSLDGWTKLDGAKAGWTGEGKAGGAMTVGAGTGNIVTKQTFGDAQLHIEFKTPAPAKGEGQDRGNSGVYFHNRYEVQVLDSFNSATYPDGQCGAIYKKHVPLVNACRAPGEWQTYDIIFLAPRFDAAGKKTANAVLTVFQNGVLIQDHAEVDGPTGAAASNDEKPGEGTLMLQDHGHAVQYRNVWLRKVG